MEVSVNVYEDGSVEPNVVHPPSTLPEPIPEPIGVSYDVNTPGYYGRLYHDDVMYGYPRTNDLKISFTNEIYPLREYRMKDGEYRVFPYSKCIVNITDTPWYDWMIDIMGQEAYSHFRVPGYGFMDTGSEKLAALPCGGDLVYTYGEVVQSGTRYCKVQVQNFNYLPDTSLTYDNAPHLFIKQYLVFDTPSTPIGWVVDKGYVGGMGDIVFPRVSKTEAVIEKVNIEFYPKPPFNTVLYSESTIIDGVKVQRQGGVEVTIDELRFSGSNTYGRVGSDWYVMEEMLVIGDPADPSLGGSWKDWRVYWNLERKAHPPAVIGWTREKEPNLLERIVGYIRFAWGIWKRTRDIPVVITEDGFDFIEKTICFLMGVEIIQRSNDD